jgi:AcrR family transcriptional regulator
MVMAARATYHHGDLRNALVGAATELAREGGPDAVVLREAARRVGVSATAAYRHFESREELLAAVAGRAMAQLARTLEDEMARTKRGRSTHDTALRRLRSAGQGYLRFAVEEPGLYRTAFAPCGLFGDQPPVEGTREQRKGPYEILSATLDDLATHGVITFARRRYAEAAVWSAVHGLALLILDGPLAQLPRADRDKCIARTLSMVTRGL